MGQLVVTWIIVIALAAVGAVALLRPDVLQELAMSATRGSRDIPIARRVWYDWARSRHYIGTIRLLGVVSLLMAAVLVAGALSTM